MKKYFPKSSKVVIFTNLRWKKHGEKIKFFLAGAWSSTNMCRRDPPLLNFQNYRIITSNLFELKILLVKSFDWRPNEKYQPLGIRYAIYCKLIFAKIINFYFSFTKKLRLDVQINLIKQRAWSLSDILENIFWLKVQYR